MTDRVDRPYKKRGPKPLYERDSLSKTKRGRQATKKIQKVRIAALRAHKPDGQALATIEKKLPDRPLSDKQLQFVRLWASGETPRTAATLAGYSEGSASIAWKLTNDPAILKLYHAEKKLYQEAMGHTRERVMSMLQEAYDHAKLVSEPSTMVAAAREIGRMCGFYEPDKHLHVHVGGKLLERMNSLSDEELLKLIEAPTNEAIDGEFTRDAA